MPLKTVIEHEGAKYALLNDDGDPLYTVNNQDIAYNGESLAERLTQVNGESATRRRELREANERLTAFEGIEDPEAARKALAIVKNLDDKKLVDAGEVETVKAAAIQATREQYESQIAQQYEPAIRERDELKTALHKEMIGGRFARSKYITDKMAVPVPMVEATFGAHFAIEDGRVVARNTAGNEIFSPSNPGERADFDEALQVLVEASPFKDQILKGRNKNGTGAPGSGGGAGSGAKTMTREQFNAMAVSDPAKLNEMVGQGLVVQDE